MFASSLRILIGLSLFLFAVIVPKTVAADQPNLVWLVSEDNSKHFLKLFDEHGAETPNIAELASHGLIYRHAFSNSPVCSVARTTLATGCYGPRIGTQYHRRNVLVPLPGDLHMFPYYLREAGYFTSNNRKKDYNAIEGRGVWDESSNRASWRNRKDGQPFFHMQSFGTSHEGSLHFNEQVYRNEKTVTDPESVFVAPTHPDTDLFRYTYARYHDRIKAVDAEIGKVVDQLKEDGLLEETFIFYFGDHGGVLPGSKGYIYEVGLHVPLVVRVPEKYRDLVDAELGGDVNGFVSFVDFGPTLLNLAGIEVPQAMDGVPFLGADVKQAEIETRNEAFGYADRFDEKYDLVRTLRRDHFKYMRSFQPFLFDGLQNNYRYKMLAYAEWRDLFQQGKLNASQSQFFQPRQAEALYDLETDPYELHNLADDPKYTEVLSELRQSLFDRMASMPDLSLFPESVFANEGAAGPVAFGDKSRERIERLLETANLALLNDSDLLERLGKALASEDAWQRYWALTACTVHGETTGPLAAQIRGMATDDSERLVRVQALVHLALVEEEDPSDSVRKELAETDDPIEAALILNSVTLLRDGNPRYEIPISESDVKPSIRNAENVSRRLLYLVD